ncbi:homocysteine S-methyltransferase family protein, partial [Thermoproteota archaeon]
EQLVLTSPETVLQVHSSFLEAGADIIETNTFGATSVVLEEYGLQDKVTEINSNAVKIAKQACSNYSTSEKPRFVAGSMGPTTKSLSITGGISFDELSAAYEKQAFALTQAGADYLLLETCMDTLNIKAAYAGIQRAFTTLNMEIPIAVSVTIERNGTMLAGQNSEAMYISIEHMNPLYVGLNCATGPDLMKEHLRSLSEISKFPIVIVPNAGIPDENGLYPQGPKEFTRIIKAYLEKGWINGAGGCCGTTPEFIKVLSKMAQGREPRKFGISAVEDSVKTRFSGIEGLECGNEGRPYLIGERANVIGSRAFKRLISEENFDQAADVARRQVKAGAQIVDICVSNPDRDEVSDIKALLDRTANLIKIPLMIDSQTPEVVEEAFKKIQGKCVLNSINMEEGEKSFIPMIPVIKTYGCGVVVGCIKGEMALTPEKKLDAAKEAHKLLTEKYGLAEENLIFDPLVFPCGTGEKNYFGSGGNTIEGVRLIKQAFPNCKTVLGISNVSFGLPPSGREVLNAVFLHHAVEAGLDLAIVNTEKIVRFSQISKKEIKLCEDLLFFNTKNSNDPIADFVSHFRDKKTVAEAVKDYSHLPLEERLQLYIIEGSKTYLEEDLSSALKKHQPVAIINDILMKGMEKVGEYFNKNELIVAEVLQSAEVMRTAIAFIEPHLKGGESKSRGTILLATVKGDVHDIGKNLVDIILSNNGYKVIDLGIKCGSEQIIQACQEHHPDIIGLSGLLVKSAQQMAVIAGDLSETGIDTPIFVGGAALTEQFTAGKIAVNYQGVVVYCQDAMASLTLANQLMDPSSTEAWIHGYKHGQAVRRGEVEDKVARVSGKERQAADAHSGGDEPRTEGGPSGIGQRDKEEGRGKVTHVRGKECRGEGEPKGGEEPRTENRPNSGVGHRGKAEDQSQVTRVSEENHRVKDAPSSGSKTEAKPVRPPDTIRHILNPGLADIWKLTNFSHVYHQLGVSGFIKEKLDSGSGKAVKVFHQIEQLKAEILEKQWIKPAVLYQFYLADSDQDSIYIFEKTGKTSITKLDFPRQKTGSQRCLADYVDSGSQRSGSHLDSLCFFVVTCGHGISKIMAELKASARYVDVIALNAIAMASCEGSAEWLHREVNSAWGVQLDKSRKQGIRVSFGYPMCPNLDDQKKIWALLEPDKEIGVSITESCMMMPEASISGLIFHKKEADYFELI